MNERATPGDTGEARRGDSGQSSSQGGSSGSSGSGADSNSGAPRADSSGGQNQGRHVRLLRGTRDGIEGIGGNESGDKVRYRRLSIPGARRRLIRLLVVR